MATDFIKKRNLKYYNRDFQSLKADFIEHLRTYFPDNIEDFNESSIGMLLSELGAFVGDNLNFYLDKKFEESFIETAKERKNIFKHAKQLGFKAFGKAAATGKVDAYIEVPSISVNSKIQPDMRYAGIIKRGAKLKNSSGITYETLEDIDFSKVDISNSSLFAVSNQDSATNEPTAFAIRSVNNQIRAGESKTATFEIASYKAFKKITLSDDDVLEVLEVKDSEGNLWYEVDYLVQDIIFDSTKNLGSNYTEVPYILKLRSVPRRFITEYDIDTNRMSLVFGTGDSDSFDGELIPDIGDLALPLYGKDTFTDFSIDPQNFLKTRTFGLAPVNTTLTIKYRYGGGVTTNAGSNDITSIAEKIFEVADTTLDQNTIRDVGNSFSVTNPKPIIGGNDELSVDEIRQLISANFAAQCRCVTDEDFIVRALSMPTKFGSVFRVNTQINPLNKNAVELVIVSKDSNNFVVSATNELKENLKTYLNKFRMITQGIELLDGKVINIAINFGILSNSDVNKTEVLSNCIEALKDYFDINKYQLGQPINITSIYKLLAGIQGVISVIELNFMNRVGQFDGRQYSNYSFSIEDFKKNNIIYIDNNSIFQIKFPGKDISGYSK